MQDYVGQQIGHYRVVKSLGRGGFAEVYLGEHIHLGTQAAIKILHAQLTSEGTTDFNREARTIAQLIHPHIVRVLDFGIEPDTSIPYLVMDYASDGTLRQRHPHGSKLELPLVLSYTGQVAKALQYAHDQKYIHRDIKPENMLIGRENTILLSDFGIATVAQSSRYQGTQDMVGTISYMAPEQIQAHPRTASDQYALAIVVYEWLCGQRPFSGTFVEIAAKHATTAPPPLRGFVQIAPDIEQVVLKALAKEPSQRFASVREFYLALEQAYQDEMQVRSDPTYRRPAPTPLESSHAAPPVIASGMQTPLLPPQAPISTPIYQPPLPQPQQTPPPAQIQPSQPVYAPSPPDYDYSPVLYTLSQIPAEPADLPLVRDKSGWRNFFIILGYFALLTFLTIPVFANTYPLSFLLNNTLFTNIVFTVINFYLLLPSALLLAGALLGWRGVVAVSLYSIEYFIFYTFTRSSPRPGELQSVLIILTELPLLSLAIGAYHKEHQWFFEYWKTTGILLLLTFIAVLLSALPSVLSDTNQPSYAKIILLILLPLIVTPITVFPASILLAIIQSIKERSNRRW